MNLSQFPERLRARVLSSIVRYGRAGIAFRVGELEGEVLPLTVAQVPSSPGPPLPPQELERQARVAFGTLPYTLHIEVKTLE